MSGNRFLFRRYFLMVLLVTISSIVNISCNQPSDRTHKSDNSDNDPMDTSKRIKSGTIDKIKPLRFYADSDVRIKFSNFNFQKNYIHDDYGDQYRYNQAERGSIFITSRIKVSAKSKTPTLPIFCAFIDRKDSLQLIGTFKYNFSKWEDYGTFLGNNADFNNDFAHVPTISFNIGLEVELEYLKQGPIYIFALKSPCEIRQEDRFAQPPVKYSDDNCITGGNINSETDLSKFLLIQILRRKK